MTVELLAHIQDMTEQLMIVRGFDRPEQVLEQAVMAMYSQLSDEQSEALGRMVQAGFDSGLSGLTIEQIFERIDARLAAAKRVEMTSGAAA